MNMTYSFLAPVFLFGHGSVASPLVRDGLSEDVELRRMTVDAQVRSGDYFITLATQLDALAKEARSDNPGLASELELAVRDLIYLQHNYQVSKKLS